LRYASAKSPLHRYHPRQTSRGSGWSEEGGRHRRSQRLWAAALVEARRAASADGARDIIRRAKGRLKHGGATSRVKLPWRARARSDSKQSDETLERVAPACLGRKGLNHRACGIVLKRRASMTGRGWMN